MQSENPGNILREPVNPASDLEWMLQSNQVSDNELLQVLVHRYYSGIYCLADILLDKKDSQDESTLITLRVYVEQALLCIVKNRHHYWGDPDLPAWIFGLALSAIQKIDQTLRKPNLPVVPAMQSGSQYSSTNRNPDMLIPALDPIQRLLLFLRYMSGLSISGLAYVLKINQVTVSAQLKILSDAMRPFLENTIDQDLQNPPAPQVDPAGPDGFETRIGDYLSTFWLMSDLSAVNEKSLITNETARLLEENDFRRKLAPHAKEIAVIGLIIMVVAALGWGLKVTAPNPDQTTIAHVRSSQPGVAVDVMTPTFTITASTALSASHSVGEKAMLTIQTGDLPNQRTPLNNQEQSSFPVSDTIDFRDSGFTSLDTVLRFWGWDAGITATLPYSAGEVNSVSYEMINAVSEQTDLKILLRVGGDEEALKRFLVAGFPIILARGFDDLVVHNGSGWTGIYGVVNGFDDVQQSFTFLDLSQTPVKTANIPYGSLERQWRAFDYLYLVVYPPSQAEKVNQVLGSQTNSQENYRQAAQKASMDAYTSIYARDQFFAWFNRGADLAYLNDQEGAASAFDQAFSMYQKIPLTEQPEQIIWYQTSFFRVYYETGCYQEMMDLAAMVINSPDFPQIEESYYWRALAEEALGNKTEAMQDLKAAIRINPNFYPAIARLENLLRKD